MTIRTFTPRTILVAIGALACSVAAANGEAASSIVNQAERTLVRVAKRVAIVQDLIGSVLLFAAVAA